jgi:adenosylhomocysteine nucleosidase
MSDEEKVVAVVCAMESEAVHLRRRLTESHEIGLSRWRRTRGRLGNVTVDIIVSGIGMVNASAATATLCALDSPAAIFNYGCAGAHREDLDAGDVVIADQVVHFSAQIVLPTGERQYMGFDYWLGDTRVQTESIPCDPELLNLCQRMASRAVLPNWPGVGQMPRIFTGVVASADVWTQHGESIRTLHDLHGSLCEEMEAAAIAQVATIHGIPFMAVKDISNNELQKATLAELGMRWPSLGNLADQVGLRAALVVEATVATLAS